MANKMPYYIYDLPFRPRKELCSVLDADRRWEELGGDYMGIDITTLTLIGQAIYREKSPTWELLNKWSERNGTIKHLFIMLAKMDYQRGMTILQPYVDVKYHSLIRNNTAATMEFSTKKHPEKELPKPVFSTSAASRLSFGSFGSEEKTMRLPSQTRSNRSSGDSKFRVDNVNINESPDGPSVPSKLNSFNSQVPKAKETTKKSMHVPNFKEAANCAEESVTDNCASEKMKNIPKMSVSKEKNMKISASKQNEALENLPDVLQFTYDELLKATDNFSKSLILGRGGFGEVYKGKWKGTAVAVKRLRAREGRNSASRHNVNLLQSFNESRILKCCRFEHILPLYGVSQDGPEPCLVYQFMANGSLEDRLLCRNNTPPLTWSQRSNIAECTSIGLNYLHTYPNKPLIHGDVKSANILLDANMKAKLGDFGLTREGPTCDDTHVKVSKLHGTQYYLPPEYLRQRHLSPQVDVYSYGVVLLEMATGLRPYDNNREDAKQLVEYVSDCNASGRIDSLRDTRAGEENMMWFGELIKIGQECSNYEKKKRPSMEHVMACFQKIQNEVSMVDKMRRLSNDRSSVGDITKLKQLTPFELQIFYDAYKEKHGIAVPSSGTSPNSHLLPNFLNDGQLHITGLEDVRGPPSDTIHLSEIRGPPSNDDFNFPYPGGHLAVNKVADHSSCGATMGSHESLNDEQSCIAQTQNNGLELQPNGCCAPLPNLTVLQMQFSEMDGNSNTSHSSKVESTHSDTYDGYSSSCSDLSRNLAN